MKAIDYEIIDDYINGTLVGEALLAFETEMQTNKELADEVALYKTIQHDLTNRINNKTESDNLRKTLQSLNQTHFQKPTAKVIPFKKIAMAISAIAAALVLLFVLRNDGISAEKLYANEINNVEPISSNLRGIATDDEIEKAKALYNAKNYTQALPKLKAIIEKNETETELVMALGICYLQTNKMDSAIQIFSKVTAGNSVFKNNAILYKALIFYKQNNIDGCKAQLMLIPTDADKYKAAQALLKKIR